MNLDELKKTIEEGIEEKGKVEKKREPGDQKAKESKYVSIYKTNKSLWLISEYLWPLLIACAVFLPWGRLLDVDISMWNLLFGGVSSEVQAVIETMYPEAVLGMQIGTVILCSLGVIAGLYIGIKAVTHIVWLVMNLVLLILGLIKKKKLVRFVTNYTVDMNTANVSVRELRGSAIWRLFLLIIFEVIIIVGSAWMPITVLFYLGGDMTVYVGWIVLYVALLIAYIALMIIKYSFVANNKKDLRNALLFVKSKREIQ